MSDEQEKKRMKEVKEEGERILKSLQLSPEERRLVGLLGPFLQVLFVQASEDSQTKVLSLYYNFQLAKERILKGENKDTTKSEGKGADT